MTHPFEGIRIIDVTHVLAGPFASYQLALLGADTDAVVRELGYDAATIGKLRDVSAI